MADAEPGDLDVALAPVVGPALAGLAAELDSVAGLGSAERGAVHAGAAAGLFETVRRKVTRVLVLELNAARVAGRLSGEGPTARWNDFLTTASRTEFWESLAVHYPPLGPRLATVVANRCAAALAMARRFADDRDRLGPLLGDASPGGPELTGVTFGAGDSHRGGHTVAVLATSRGPLIYKPRSLAVDQVLARFLDAVLRGWRPETRIRVPAVVTADGWGWAAHVEHRWCAGDAELAAFYRNLGHWLAVMRLLGGSDLHAENVIACGPVPVVVDCETLFAPHLEAPPTGVGLAVDRAAMLVSGSVLRIGLLPGRGLALGWRGVDSSAIGNLPDQQPEVDAPVLVDEGTDRARIELRPQAAPLALNHPSPDPQLGRWWEEVLDGFAELTARLTALDRAGSLEPLLAPFRSCPIRVVPRATESYSELARMLWHPVSLHDPGPAAARAVDLLTRRADAVPGVPTAPDVVAAEVAELLDGDVPVFETTPADGVLAGPRGTTSGERRDLVAHALARWRDGDLAFELNVIRTALVSAYLNEGWARGAERLAPPLVHADDLDRRRRAVAAGIVRRLRDTAVRAEDGTATWVAPVLTAPGWQVQPLEPELYNGLPGVAVLLAAYQREVAAGRADEVDGTEELLGDVLRTVRAIEDYVAEERLRLPEGRPPAPGGWTGLASQVWAWLLLDDLGRGGGDGLRRATALADQVPTAVEADDVVDVLTGMAGAVVPLLALARRSGDDRWAATAVAVGERLVALADVDDHGRACWRTTRWPEGLGGFAHGATGIGWALARLARATGDDRFAAMAAAADDYEETLHDPATGAWTDLRQPDVVVALWCHGATGIGLAAADRLVAGGAGAGAAADVVRRAASAAWTEGMGWNHTICHGELGSWELVATAIAAGSGPPRLDRRTLDARVVSSLERHGPVSGLARDAFVPGLFPGLGGVAYQLLRLHSDCDLPSLLVPDP